MSEEVSSEEEASRKKSVYTRSSEKDEEEEEENDCNVMVWESKVRTYVREVPQSFVLFQRRSKNHLWSQLTCDCMLQSVCVQVFYLLSY